VVDFVEDFAARIPVEDRQPADVPREERGPLRAWSVA
jgi:hypothetical protein